jgi:hypothetical protein
MNSSKAEGKGKAVNSKHQGRINADAKTRRTQSAIARRGLTQIGPIEQLAAG